MTLLAAAALAFFAGIADPGAASPPLAGPPGAAPTRAGTPIAVLTEPAASDARPGPAHGWRATSPAARLLPRVPPAPVQPLLRDAVPRPAPAQIEDRWLAEDKLRHFLASFGGLNLTFGALRTAGLDREPAMAGAAAATLAAGLWKEWRDRRGGGPFSGRDLVWDGFGILAGLALAASTR